MIGRDTERWLIGGLSEWCAPLLLKSIYRSSRIQLHDRNHYDRIVERGQNYILCFWHGQMLPLLSFFQGKGLYTFISPHRDGEYAARALEGMGNHCVRTSPRDRRVRALGEALRLTREGESLAIAPDGPLGPAFELKPGILKMSKKLECPILPVVGLSSRTHFFDSWDAFAFPLPLGTIEIRFLTPFSPWKEETDTEAQQIELNERMNRATRDLARDVLPDPRPYLETVPEP